MAPRSAPAPNPIDPADRSGVDLPPRLPRPPAGYHPAGHQPAGPAALSRRVGAGLIDLIWIGIPTILVARLTGEPVVAPSWASSASTSQLETAEQFDRWQLDLALANHSVGLSTGALAIILATMILAAVLAMVVVPLLDEGRTPGMALLRLRIVGVDRRRPTAWALTVRTVCSTLDLMPVVVPGLVGFAFAASNPHRQRIGDRLAGTTVVHEPRPTRRLAGGGEPRRVPILLNPQRLFSDLRFDTVARPSPGLAGAAVASSGWMLGDPGSMTNYSAHITPGQALDRPPVAERPRFNPYPKPQRPRRRQQPEQRPPANGSRPDFAAASGVIEDESGATPAGQSIRSPEWNEDWQSWVYWDDDRRQWLRFDSETGDWEPML